MPPLPASMPTPSIANPIGPINQSSRWKAPEHAFERPGRVMHTMWTGEASRGGVTAARFGQFRTDDDAGVGALAKPSLDMLAGQGTGVASKLLV